jgi:hypothetical protein
MRKFLCFSPPPIGGLGYANFSADALSSPALLPHSSPARSRSRGKKRSRAVFKANTPQRGSSSPRHVNESSIPPEGTRSSRRARQGGSRAEVLEGGGLASGVYAAPGCRDVSPERRRDRAADRSKSQAGLPVPPSSVRVPRRTRSGQAQQKDFRSEGPEGGGLASRDQAGAAGGDVSPERRRDRATSRATSQAGIPFPSGSVRVPRRSRVALQQQKSVRAEDLDRRSRPAASHPLRSSAAERLSQRRSRRGRLSEQRPSRGSRRGCLS